MVYNHWKWWHLTLTMQLTFNTSNTNLLETTYLIVMYGQYAWNYEDIMIDSDSFEMLIIHQLMWLLISVLINVTYWQYMYFITCSAPGAGWSTHVWVHVAAWQKDNVCVRPERFSVVLSSSSSFHMHHGRIWVLLSCQHDTQGTPLST
jgi:hypothetical protein